MPALGATWRALRVTEHLLTGIVIALAIAPLPRVGIARPWLPDLVSWWHRRLCRCLSLRIETHGLRRAPALLVSNHVSWIDIPALAALGPVTFLSKVEVRDWPVIGWLSVLSGTLFLKRGAHQTGAMTQQIAACLQAGQCVTVFPEGTTSDGTTLLRFHSRLFAVAQQSTLTLQPVAIRYGRNGKPDPVAPFIGDDSLLPHLWRVLRRPGMRVEISFLPPVASAVRDRRALAEACRTAIAQRLGLHDEPELELDTAGELVPGRAAAGR